MALVVVAGGLAPQAFTTEMIPSVCPEITNRFPYVVILSNDCCQCAPLSPTIRDAEPRPS